MKESGGFDAMTLEGDKANLFRAQRNVYVAGLTLFLALVIRRVMALITALGDIRDKYKQVIMHMGIESPFYFQY